MEDKGEKVVLNEWLVGRIVTCDAPKHEGAYAVWKIDKKRNTAWIQRPDEFKAHWVNARHLRYA